MTNRSRAFWILGVVVALVGCGGGEMTGNSTRGNGTMFQPGQPQAGAAASGQSGSGGLIDPNLNPIGPAMMRTKINAEQPCASVSIVANRVLPTVMLVVDGSGSMESGYGPAPDGGMPLPNMAAPGQSTRWQAVREALVKADVGVVPSLQGLVKFGMAVYGTMPTCPLPTPIIDPVLNNYNAINGALPGSPPGMFTPTGPALDMVVDKLPDPTAGLGPDGKLPGPQIVVLATDGEPNSCGSMDLFGGFPVTDYAPSLAAAMKLQQKHLKMYVVSVAEASGEFANHLQQMANIGQGLPIDMNPGAQVYYPEDPTALAETLKTLIGAELSCDLALEGKGVKKGLECNPGSVVTLNGQALECNGQDGWELTDETHIRLKGTACDLFKNATDAALTATFPCEIIKAL